MAITGILNLLITVALDTLPKCLDITQLAILSTNGRGWF